jgi:spore germination cell wall hydrolase CwlJ-like protein
MFDMRKGRRSMRIISSVLNGIIAITVMAMVYNSSLSAKAETANVPEITTIRTADVVNHVEHRVSMEDLQCLAENIYFEAGTESYAGKVAVALVTLTRVNDTRYPNSICEVVKQGPVRESWKTKQDPDLSDEERKFYPVRHMCQFSWYCDGKADKIDERTTGWKQSQEVAYKVAVLGLYKGMVEYVTHYHATYVSPNWRHEFTVVGRIDTHIFYRWD